MRGNLRGYALAVLALTGLAWLGAQNGDGGFAAARFFGNDSSGVGSQWSSKGSGTLMDVPCAFDLPSGVEGACYRFAVPQDWSSEDGPMLELAVAVVTQTAQVSDAPPVVYLEGGPGGPALPAAGTSGSENVWVTEDFAPVFSAGRALVLLDGRGVGASRPFLSCPEAMKQVWRDFRMPPNKRSLGAYLRDVEKCISSLSADGVVFSAYNSAQFAQDLKRLRLALGYDQWALYGVSYGAQTALAAVRADDGGIDRVIFDSPSYARGDVWNRDQDAFDRVLSVLDAACDAGEICAPGQRGMNARLQAVFDQLNVAPMRVRRSGGFVPVYVDGYLALYGIHLLLYYDLGPQILWSVISDLGNRDEAQAQFLVDLVYDQYAPSGFSDVVNWATYCQEDDVFSLYTRVSDLPVYEAQDVKAFQTVCQMMGFRHHADGAVASAVSGKPVIVFSGAWDPITPPDYGAALARDIGAVAHIVRPRATHSAAFKHEDACAQEILTAFLRSADGRVSASCSQ